MSKTERFLRAFKKGDLMFEEINLIESDVNTINGKINGSNSSAILPTVLTEKGNMLYLINDPKTKEDIGVICLYDINPVNQNAWISGFVTDRKHTNKLITGYIKLICKGMTELNLQKISAKHLVGDYYYQHIYQYLRFMLEGNSRNDVKIAGEFYSVQIRSLLSHEFRRYYLSGNHIEKMCSLEGF